MPPFLFHVKEENMMVILAATGYRCPETRDHINSNLIASILSILRYDIVLLLSFAIWLQKNWLVICLLLRKIMQKNKIDPSNTHTDTETKSVGADCTRD